jgi:hypothetical protein
MTRHANAACCSSAADGRPSPSLHLTLLQAVPHPSRRLSGTFTRSSRSYGNKETVPAPGRHTHSSRSESRASLGHPTPPPDPFIDEQATPYRRGDTAAANHNQRPCSGAIFLVRSPLLLRALPA